MNYNDDNQREQQTPVVTFCNIPLDDDEPSLPIGYDSIPDDIPQEVTVVDVQFKRNGKIYYFDPGNLIVKAGDEVIIDTARGAEYGFCSGGNHLVPKEKLVSPLRAVIRVATETDKRTRQEFKSREEDAFIQCQNKITDHKLDMKLVSAEYSFDGSKILFYFTSDGRVDFRELVKDLAAIFRTRIELRQIGVRDEAKMLGGLGICGRTFCCKQFLDDFQPVSIKMAKTQSLSLNPTKISGTCGRLMCCLKYEQDSYESLIRSSPKTESLVNTCDGIGTVTDSNLLKQTVKVRLENDPSTIKTYNNSDICVLRNGKAKKSDPPVPLDLPPLPKPEEKQPESIAMFDESTLSNFSYPADEEKKSRSSHHEKETESTGHHNGHSRSKSGEKAKRQQKQSIKKDPGKEAKPHRDGKRSYHRRFHKGKKQTREE